MFCLAVSLSPCYYEMFQHAWMYGKQFTFGFQAHPGNLGKAIKLLVSLVVLCSATTRISYYLQATLRVAVGCHAGIHGGGVAKATCRESRGMHVCHVHNAQKKKVCEPFAQTCSIVFPFICLAFCLKTPPPHLQTCRLVPSMSLY